MSKISYREQFKECLEFGIVYVNRKDILFCNKYKTVCTSATCKKERNTPEESRQLDFDFN